MFFGQIFAKNAKNDPKTLFKASKSVKIKIGKSIAWAQRYSITSGAHCWCHLLQSMEWIELLRSSPVQIHDPLILIQSSPADDPETESSPVQSIHNRVGICQIPCKICMYLRTNECIAEDLRAELQTSGLR